MSSCKIYFIVACVTVIGYAGLHNTSIGRDFLTVFACEDRIKEILKDPETATFGDTTLYSWKSTGNLQKIAIKVRAANSFGGFVTSTMSCNYDKKGQFKMVTY